MKHTIEYQMISAHYGDQVAKRSQVPLINHINEGLVVLDELGSTEAAKKAFCLHPLLQCDDDLAKNSKIVALNCSPEAVMLTMEYRNIANDYLSDKVNTDQEILLSPLAEVNQMLVADKVQNFKDFLTYHSGTHARSAELSQYFSKWLTNLHIDVATYQNLCRAIDESK